MKYIIKQYFDTYFEKKWVFDNKEEAKDFFERKCRESQNRYKVTYSFGEIEGGENERD